jgi:hypothetical protein
MPKLHDVKLQYNKMAMAVAALEQAQARARTAQLAIDRPIYRKHRICDENFLSVFLHFSVVLYLYIYMYTPLAAVCCWPIFSTCLNHLADFWQTEL